MALEDYTICYESSKQLPVASPQHTLLIKKPPFHKPYLFKPVSIYDSQWEITLGSGQDNTVTSADTLRAKEKKKTEISAYSAAYDSHRAHS